MKKRSDLQGIRGIAISSVLLYHFIPMTFKNGYDGVDQFFILSGFLMAEILSRESSVCFSMLTSFYYRRLKRILPLYLLFILIILIISNTSLFSYTTFGYNIPYAIRSLAFISNTKIGGANPTYEELLFNAEVLYTHTWSLSCEVQFYLIAPFIIIIPAILDKNIILYIICIISYFSFTYLWETGSQELAFNIMLTRIWQFLLGALCSTNNKKQTTKLQSVDYELLLPEKKDVIEDDIPTKSESSLLSLFSNLTIGSMLLLCCFPIEITPHYVRLFTCFSTASLIYSGCISTPNSFLSNRFLVYLGDISYSLYLIHWPVYVYLKQTQLDHKLVPFIGIAISLLLATIVYHTYEKYYLSLDKCNIISLISLLYFISIYIIIIYSPSSIFYKEKEVIVTQSYLQIPNNLTIDIVTSLNNNFTKLDVPLLNLKECKYKTLHSNEAPPWGKICTIKNSTEISLTGTKRLMLIGNSYAANIARMFIRIKECQLHSKQIQLYTRVACEVLDDTVHGTFCLNKTEEFYEAVKLVKPDALFITTRHMTSMIPPITDIVDDRLEYERKMLQRIEKDVKYKVFILNAIPAPMSVKFNEVINAGLKSGKMPSQASLIDNSTNHQYLLARKRMVILSKECIKCELIDVMPSLTNKNGTFQMYDENNGLTHFVQGHFSNYGLQKISNQYRKACMKIKQ